MWVNRGNPIYYNDPKGDCPNCVTAAIGAGVGALLGGGIEAGVQLYNEGSVTDWAAVGGSALQGGITGGAAGFTGGASLLATAAVAGSVNVVGGAVNRSIQGQGTTLVNVATDATVGVVAGAGGKLLGSAVSNAAKGVNTASKIPAAVNNLAKVSQVTKAAKGGIKAIQAGEYTITKTVANKLATRPYINSPSTISNILKTGEGVPDAFFKGGMNYKVPGEFNGSKGIFELGINPETNTIYHFLFKTVK